MIVFDNEFRAADMGQKYSFVTVLAKGSDAILRGSNVMMAGHLEGCAASSMGRYNNQSWNN